jgi:hypothetical protein
MHRRDLGGDFAVAVFRRDETRLRRQRHVCAAVKGLTNSMMKEHTLTITLVRDTHQQIEALALWAWGAARNVTE